MSDLDVYIKCANNVKIFYYGNKKLHVYFPSKQRCKNILSQITEQYGDKIIFDTEESDKEMFFKFKSDDFCKLEPYLLPLTGGCDISPFSTKNLRKNKYNIPSAELEQYKIIVSVLPLKDTLKINIYTNNFVKTLTNNSSSLDDIKSDMRKSGLKNKEYIHSIGQWTNYLSYLQRRLADDKIYCNK